jgi:prepilin-type N-terminal cleavage/methylation domain-containing protein
MENNSITPQGFSLLELLIAAVIVIIGTTWSIPQYRRQLALRQLDQYTQQVESGLFSLRARQSVEGTSCQLNFNPNYVGIDNTEGGYGQPVDVMELSHLTEHERDQRLQCCDSTACRWDSPYRLMSQENTEASKAVEIKTSEAEYSLSPPGTSTDGNALILLVRSINWNQDPQRPLPLRCVQLSTTGHLHRGTWEEKRCRRR